MKTPDEIFSDSNALEDTKRPVQTSIRAIVFDADGVLINPTWLFARHLKEKYGLDRGETKDFFHGPFLDCMEGKANLLSELAPYIKCWGLSLSVKEFIETWFSLESSIDLKLAGHINDLRQSNIPCFMATNQEHCRAQYMRHSMKIESYFDKVFFSCELGVRKPKTEFFKKVADRIGCLPQEILFFDDSLEFLTGAQASGWQIAHYTGVESFQTTLKNLNVLRQSTNDQNREIETR